MRNTDDDITNKDIVYISADTFFNESHRQRFEDDDTEMEEEGEEEDISNFYNPSAIHIEA